MKNRRFLSLNALAFFSVILLWGCGTSAPGTTAGPKSDRTYTSLLDMLRNQPQLNITGAGNNVEIRIRGSRSLVGNNEPLFVLDGAPVGSGYNSASSVDVNMVQSIRVLPGGQAAI
jgi:hypothetical protein